MGVWLAIPKILSAIEQFRATTDQKINKSIDYTSIKYSKYMQVYEAKQMLVAVALRELKRLGKPQ
jgi:hypothetical protein